MKQYGVSRNTIRDYIGICELKIIDAEKYKTVVQEATGEKGEASVKCIEKRCRVALREYRAQANKALWLPRNLDCFFVSRKT